MKEELGLDRLECRSWRALEHHALLTLLAFLFLQHLRPSLPAVRRRIALAFTSVVLRCPHRRQRIACCRPP